MAIEGALFRSPHRLFRQKVTVGIPAARHPLTGDVTEWKIRPILADHVCFGTAGPEQTMFSPESGTMIAVADIQGGFYNTAEKAKEFGWNDDEHQLVIDKLREVQRTRPDYVQEVVAVRVAAPLPWSTYDELSPAEIVEFAPKLRLIAEAVRYERENLARPDVINPLEVELETAGLSADPLEEIPAHMLEPMDPTGVTVQTPPKHTESGIPLDTPGFQPKPGVIVL